MAARSFSEVKLAVLLKLYFAALANINDGRLTTRQIVSLDFEGTPSSLVEKAIFGLKKEGFLYEHQDFSAGDFDFIYDISAEGLSYVEAEVNKGQGYLAENFEREREWADTFTMPEWSPSGQRETDNSVRFTEDGIARATEYGNFRVTEATAEDDNSDNPSGSVDLPIGGFLNTSQPPSASTAPSSAPFGFAPGSAPFDQGNFADTRTAPASDRYVSVLDNQSPFDEVLRSLTVIKNEFAEDHFKHTNFINTPAITAEIEAFEHQIRSGWVSRPAAQNFLETLHYIKDVCVEFKEICVAAAVAIAALTAILGMLL